MFADIAGYTALMQEDEVEARSQRDRHRAILTAAVERHEGRVLQYYGDGTLSIFASAVEAVECAVEVQLEVNREPLNPLRIGVHTGDIVHDAEGVYGDGVNVASRIENLSVPGGVMVSGKVYDEIKNHPSLSAVAIGAVRLKNVRHRISVFAISNAGLSVPTVADVRAKAESEGAGSFAPSSELTGDDGTPLPAVPVGVGEAFLQRVKDRALVQWSVVYLAVAAVVIQVVRFASGLLAWSPLVSQGVAFLGFLGFFVALVVAWYHGEKGRQRVQRAEVLIIAILLGVAAAGLRLLPTRSATVPSGAVTTPEDGRPSIAVLPWVNRSGLSEDAWFTDGIHDEILTRLSKISGLRVISRQSVMQFRDSPLSARQIANQLGVQYILEAGLLRINDTVRVNVQLVNGRTEDLEWAATDDRYLTMENLLSIQAEIAQTIADTLRATVTPAERAELDRTETDNLEAYDYYLQGRIYYLRPGYAQADYQAAQSLFERAIDLDPGFALAHASLSRVHGTMYWERFDSSPQRLQLQRSHAREALRLEPGLAQALLAIGWADYVAGDFESALARFEAARRGLPNDAEIVSLIGYAHRRLGHWPEVFAAFDQAIRLSPRDATLFYDLGGHSYAARRRYAEAVRSYNTALSLAPDFHDAALRKAEVYVHWQGQLDTMRAVIAALPVDLHSPAIEVARADLALRERDATGLLRFVADEINPIFETQLVYLPGSIYSAWAHRLLHDEQSARIAWDSARGLLEPLARRRPQDDRVMAALGYAYAGLGRAADAMRIAEALVSAAQGNAFGQPKAMETAARILAQAGLADPAAGQLDRLLSESSPVSIRTLELDPLYDPVRDSPAFRRLIEKHPSGSQSGSPEG
jgi:TolB-like protein